jgi:CPA1 family monovalent cation:H+ antiporter
LEHAVGSYLILLSIACAVGIAVKGLTHVPYTIALTIVGLAIAIFRVGPDIRETGFGKELVFFVLLPPLLFQGSLHMQLDRLRRLIVPIAAFATIGVIVSTVLIGSALFATGVLPEMKVAMLFGALICTTDPVSVLAIFRQSKVPADLKYLVEGESLFNDGTGVVVFVIVLDSIVSGAEFSLGGAVVEFLKVTLGGTAVGVGFGLIAYSILRRFHDHLLENAFCLLLCYGSFFVAEHFHLSGVIATVCSGLLIGNYGRTLAMDGKTTETVETFFESIDFIINSLLFILIGLELQEISGAQLRGHAGGIALAVLTVTLTRCLVIYPLFFGARRFAGGLPGAWAHVLNWGGLRGSIPIALLLGLRGVPQLAEHRSTLLVLGFGVVCFSLIVQGLTMKPLIGALKLQSDSSDLSDPAHQQKRLV